MFVTFLVYSKNMNLATLHIAKYGLTAVLTAKSDSVVMFCL